MRPPAFKLPAGTCDSHCHVWGPVARFPYAEDRPYTPPERDKDVLAALYARLGIERSVIVQPIVYGTDMACTLDAIAADPERRRGIALVGSDTSDATLEAWHEGGIRGVRFGFVKHLGVTPDLAFMRRTAERIKALGWHLQLHLDADQLDELATVLMSLPVPFVIDHMGRVDAALGVDQPAFRQLLSMAAHEQCWVKLSGADRVAAAGAPFHDVIPFAAGLIATAPDRVVWGTDFPHPNARHAVEDEATLVDLLAAFGSAAELQQLLVDNPTRLYGFGPLT